MTPWRFPSLITIRNETLVHPNMPCILSLRSFLRSTPVSAVCLGKNVALAIRVFALLKAVSKCWVGEVETRLPYREFVKRDIHTLLRSLGKGSG